MCRASFVGAAIVFLARSMREGRDLMIGGTLGGILGLIHLVLFVIAAIEILGSNKSLGNKLLWLLLILFLPLIGLIIYFLMGRGK
jgi:hypothetical protein